MPRQDDGILWQGQQPTLYAFHYVVKASARQVGTPYALAEKRVATKEQVT